jgi:ketosteroid isomerase-like protein
LEKIMTTTMSPAAAVAAEFFRRFGAGDFDGVLELFADNVDWDVPGAPEVPWTGRRRTRADIRAFLSTVAAEVRTREFTVDRVLADGEHGVALGRFTHEVLRTGRAFSCGFALHIHVRDGRIDLYHMFEDSAAVAAAYRP